MYRKRLFAYIWIVAALLLPATSHAIDQGYTNFKSSINVVGLTKGTTIWASTALKLHDGTMLTSTTQFAGGGLTLGTTNGLSLAGGSVLSLTTATTSRTGALNSIDFTTFNNKLSTTSAASTYLTQSSATATYLPITTAANTYLTQSSASSTYFPIASTGTLSNTFLTNSSATATYLQTADAASTYLGKSSATATYLQSATASSLYLTQSSATATYVQQSSTGSFLTTSSATANYLTLSSAAVTYDNVNASIAASRIAAGSLGASVIASSIAVNAVTNPSIVSMDGSKITGTASIPSASIDGSSVTKQGNTFNGNSQLVQTTAGGLLPALSAANLTSIPAGNLTGTVPNSTLDSSSVTKYGPNIPAASVSAGSLGSSVIASSIAVSGVTAGTYGSATQVPVVAIGGDGRTTSATNTTISLTNSNLQAGTYTNVTVPAANVAAGSLGGSVMASSVAANAVLDASIVSVSGSKVTGGVSLTTSTITGNFTVTNGTITATSSGNGAKYVWGDGSTKTAMLYSDSAYFGVQTVTRHPLLFATNCGAAPNCYTMFITTDSKVGIGLSLDPFNLSAQLETNGTVRFRNFGTGVALFDSLGNLSSGNVPAASVAAGSLGTSVIASSIAVSAVQDASIVGVSASKLTGTGTLPNAVVDGSSVTKQGNSFNAASQLLQLDSSALVPNANISASSITKQGNTFNGTSQLVQTTSGGILPALSAANLTSIPAANLTGNFAVTNSTVTTLNTTTIANGGIVNHTLSGGNTTRPNNAFVLVKSTGATDVTGDGTTYSIQFGSVTYDIGGNWDSTNNRFTAPVTGKYLVVVNITLENILVTHNNFLLTINASSRQFNNITGGLLARPDNSFAATAFVDMTAGDVVRASIAADSGTKTIDVIADQRYNWFEIQLVQ